MWTLDFWKDAAERAIKTFAQVLAAVLVAGEGLGILDVDWGDALSVAALAAVVSVLTSVGSIAVGTRGTASLVD